MIKEEIVCDICENSHNLVYCQDYGAICDDCLCNNNDVEFVIFKGLIDIDLTLMLKKDYTGLRCNIYRTFTLRELIDLEVETDNICELLIGIIDKISHGLECFEKDFCDYFGLNYFED